MLTTVDMRSVPPKRCSSMVMWCNVVVLEQPATTYRELPPAGWTSPIFPRGSATARGAEGR